MTLKRKLLTALYGGALVLPACGDASTDANNGNGDGWTVDENASPNNANGNPNATPNGDSNATPNGESNATPNGDPNGDPNVTPNGDPNVTPNGDPNATPNGDPNNVPIACDADDLQTLPYEGWQEAYYAGALPEGVYLVCAPPSEEFPCDELKPETANQFIQHAFNTFCGVEPYYDMGDICGPLVLSDNLCCHAIPLSFAECVVGRPLTVDGEVRTGGLGSATGWRSDLAIDASQLNDTMRAQVAAWWADAGEHEHASIASFSRFLLDLMALGAPRELVVGTTQAIDDEVRHASDCFAIASAYAGVDLAPGPIDVGGYEPQGLQAAMVAAIREGCIGETLAAALAEWQAPRAQNPLVRDVLTRIADDEGDHALVAWAFVKWVIDNHPTLRDAARDAFAEAAVDLASPWTTGADGADRAAIAHGALPPGIEDRLRRHAYHEVVVPCVEALFS